MKRVLLFAVVLLLGSTSFAQDWVQAQKVIAEDLNGLANFGNAVHISENWAIVGAWRDNTIEPEAGAAYVYQRNNDQWDFYQKLTPSNIEENDRFGYSVYIDENTILVGAIGSGVNDEGSVFYFVNNGSNWVQQQIIQASDAQEGDFFGVSVEAEGDVLICGSMFSDNAGEESQSGAAYIFRLQSENWIEEQIIVPSDNDVADNFGSDVSISGNKVAISAPNDRFDDIFLEGSVYIYVFDETSWNLEQKLTLDVADGQISDSFGRSLSLDQNRLMVGSQTNLGGGFSSGAVGVFEFLGTSWVQTALFTGSDIQAFFKFGYSLQLDGNRAVIGLWDTSIPTNETLSGRAYVYELINGTWTEQQVLEPNDGDPNDQFGFAVSISEGYILVGSQIDSDFLSGAGSAYFFEDETFIGIKESEFNTQISLYPNPTQNSFSMEGIDGVVNVRILTIDGKLVSMVHNVTNNELIPIDILDTGLYFVEVFGASGSSLNPQGVLKLMVK